MIISYRWLMEYLSEEVPVDLLDKILTGIGLEVEGIEPLQAVPGGLEGLVVGEVLTCVAHPDADKLKITTVNIGLEQALQIVCGAPNVAAGQKVIVATAGTTIYPTNGTAITLKKAKIRGAESNGMICAEDEIGIGQSHEGILILPTDTPVGMTAAAYFQLPQNDYALHIGLTPNRSDAHSHIGVAREVAAWLQYHHNTSTYVQWPALQNTVGDKSCPFSITLQDKSCPRYMGALLEGINIKPSPDWLKERLTAIGLRPINNVVDITNFVLHEMGNPLHAFDADAIEGEEIIVRKAAAGSTFVTLDGKTLQLQEHDLIIADTNKPLCLAGVMGGQNSGVTDNTKRIFLEAAWFDAATIRKTSVHHGIRSDAATHFEKGISATQVPIAMQRAISLLQQYADAVLVGGITDVYPQPKIAATVTVRMDYVRKLSGHAFTASQVQRILTPLGFVFDTLDEHAFTLTIPDYKTDIEGPADIVEEIIRMHGLDNIAIPQQLRYELKQSPTHPSASLKDKASAYLIAQGFQELVTNSIINAAHYQEYENKVSMINSLSAELNALRPDMALSGLEVVAYNLNRKSHNLKLFEFGHTYHTTAAGHYTQQEWLCLWITGDIQETSWQAKARPADFYFIKGLCTVLAQQCGIANLHFEPIGANSVAGKQGNQHLLTIRPASPKECAVVGIKSPVWYAAIDWQKLVSASKAGRIKYAEVPKNPAVERDLAIVVEQSLPFSEVDKVTRQLKLQPLQKFSLFDVFEHEKIGVGKKSMALNFVFQLADRTLTDTETESLMQSLANAYRTKLNAQVRE